MFDSLVSLATFVICVWLLINVGAKASKSVKKTNRGIKRTIRRTLKSVLEDD